MSSTTVSVYVIEVSAWEPHNYTSGIKTCNFPTDTCKKKPVTSVSVCVGAEGTNRNKDYLF